MAAAESQSAEALHQLQEKKKNPTPTTDDDDDEDDDEDDDDYEDVDVEEHECGAVVASEDLHGNPLLQTLATHSAERRLLSSVAPLDYATHSSGCSEIEMQVGMSHQEVLANEEGHIVQEYPHSSCRMSSVEYSPTSVTQSISSVQSPTVPDRKPVSDPDFDGVLTVEVNKKNSYVQKMLATPFARTPSSDGYNWRKYGQKQVKFAEGSRSYYKCTYLDCCAKKIECSDESRNVVDMIYKGEHNHEPPRKVKCSRERRLVSHATPVVECNMTVDYANDLYPSMYLKEPARKTVSTHGTKRLNPDTLNGVENPKPIGSTGNLEYSNSPLQPGRKPKLVLHAASDVGISEDGYRWRKYGQKMVKGNPNPRNYYRCTSAGCPVRKHTETAVDNTSSVIITYKDLHDHGMPVPKKRHGSRLVSAAAPTSMNTTQLRKAEAYQHEMKPSQWSVDTESAVTGEALDLGCEKALESARTLLSIGFEIKPC